MYGMHTMPFLYDVQINYVVIVQKNLIKSID